MEKLNNTMKTLNFEHFATSQHKISPANFLASPNALFLDLRTKEEIDTLSINLKHHMPVLNIPIHELPERLIEIPKDKKVGLFCSSGVRIAIAYLYLKTAGFENIVMLPGGLEALVAELKPGKIQKAIKAKS